MTEEELAAWLPSQGYLKAKVLQDGTVAALLQLTTTRSVCLDCNEFSWERRFCFDPFEGADAFYESLKSCDDRPKSGYVARRPQFEDHADPYLNDLHNRPWYRVYEKNPRQYNRIMKKILILSGLAGVAAYFVLGGVGNTVAAAVGVAVIGVVKALFSGEAPKVAPRGYRGWDKAGRAHEIEKWKL